MNITHTGTVWGAWHGGANYSPTPWTQAERFESLEACTRAFEDRAGTDPFYPCVYRDPAEQGGPTMVVFFYDPATTDDGDPYPDVLLEFDVRGDLVISPC